MKNFIKSYQLATDLIYANFLFILTNLLIIGTLAFLGPVEAKRYSLIFLLFTPLMGASMVALHKIVFNAALEDGVISIKSFFKSIKENYIRSGFVTLTVALLLFVISVNVEYFKTNGIKSMYLLSIFVGSFLTIALLNFLVLESRYETPWKNSIMNAVIASIKYPLTSLYQMILLIFILLIVGVIPLYSHFIIYSLYSFLLLKVYVHHFNTIEEEI